MMGSLDTLGKPIRFRYATIPGSTMRTGTVKDGYLYATFIYATGGVYKNVLLKADTALNIAFANEYNMQQVLYGNGLQVSNTGSIYFAGDYFYGGINGSYSDIFIIKYGPQGETGTCNFLPFNDPFPDLPVTTATVTLTPFTRNYPNDVFTLAFTSSNTLLNVNQVLCSSLPVCTFIQLNKPAPVCQLNHIFPVAFRKDALCTLRPQWQYDTSRLQLHSTTDSTGLFSFKKAGATWLRASLNAGCSMYADSLLLSIAPSPDKFSLGADTVLCPHDSVLLHAGPGFVSYAWQDGAA